VAKDMEAMGFESRKHEEFLELCAASVSERLSPEEEERLRVHLGVCDECINRLRQYRAIEQFGLPVLASEDVPDGHTAVDPSAQDQEKVLKRLLEQCAAGAAQSSVSQSRHGLAEDGRTRMLRNRGRMFTPAFAALLRYAAAILVAVSIFLSGYRLALERNKKSSAELRDAAQKAATSVEKQMETLLAERNALGRAIQEKDTREAKLVARIHDQEVEIQDLGDAKRAIEESNAQVQVERSKLDADRDALATKLSSAERDLAALKGELDPLRRQREHESAQVVALNERIGQLTKLLDERNETISQDKQLLASDRDIRELMGARELYITEVHDVARNGKTQKPFARVFYTKGKSLIFYAYDLDQQPGIKTASTFQAWGVREGDQKQPLNLGIFYTDNVAGKRWVLRFDDPRTLEELNAVFVTVEPNGGSPLPSGKQLLFAYLRVRPNHP